MPGKKGYTIVELERIREYAKAALTGLLSADNKPDEGEDPTNTDFASWAFNQAEAMLEEEQKRYGAQ